LRHALFKAYPHFQRVDDIASGSTSDVESLANIGGMPVKIPFISTIDDFYLSNPVARASTTMAECSAIAEGHATLTAAE
jgi:NADH-quinone oxidoreductase subunit G